MKYRDLEMMIKDIYEGLETNNFSTLSRPGETMWEEPLMGVAAGDDPGYDSFKELIGDFHWTPEEAFRLKYQEQIDKAKLRVVSIIFPQKMITKQMQAKAVKCPSREWIVSRGEWEVVMHEFSTKLVSRLEAQGFRSVSIDLQAEFSVIKSEEVGFASNWSHRHSAYLAGLGTFGLSDGLITEKGKAVRLTSLIVEAPLEVTPRTYTSHNEWCLYYKNGTCKACIQRCPIEAITIEGHDKDACEAYEEVFAEKYWPKDIERKDYILGCGLCQVGIPCQHKRP